MEVSLKGWIQVLCHVEQVREKLLSIRQRDLCRGVRIASPPPPPPHTLPVPSSTGSQDIWGWRSLGMSSPPPGPKQVVLTSLTKLSHPLSPPSPNAKLGTCPGERVQGVNIKLKPTFLIPQKIFQWHPLLYLLQIPSNFLSSSCS